MIKNQYKQATRHFGIPVPGFKDGIWPELELKKWQMVENLLLAAMRGNVNAIFREGDMRIIKESDGTCSVFMSATGNEPSVQGAVGGAFFEAQPSFVWDKLEIGQSYFLYVRGSTDTFQDQRAVSPVSSITRQRNPYVTLVAKVSLIGDKFEIDRNPPGKINARDLAQHVLDYDNPHGDTLVQNEMLIRNRLVIGDGCNASIGFEVNGEIKEFSSGQIVSGLLKLFVDFISSGKTGTKIRVDGNVKFVSVLRTQLDEKNLGEVAVGLYGVSPEVSETNEFIVWNTGDAGIPMRAMIFCE